MTYQRCFPRLILFALMWSRNFRFALVHWLVLDEWRFHAKNTSVFLFLYTCGGLVPVCASQGCYEGVLYCRMRLLCQLL